jgi:hypothetical protein
LLAASHLGGFKKAKFAKRTQIEKFINNCKSIINEKTPRHFDAKTNPFLLVPMVQEFDFKAFQSDSKSFKAIQRFFKKIFFLGDRRLPRPSPIGLQKPPLCKPSILLKFHHQSFSLPCKLTWYIGLRMMEYVVSAW